MAYLLFFILFVLGYLRPKSRILSCVQLLYIWIIIAFNTASPDYLNNEFMFNNINSGLYVSYEPIYVLLIRISHIAGLDFVKFRCVIAGLLVIFLWKTVQKANTLQNTALSILMVYPVIMFASGLRSAVAYGITIYAIVCYLMSDEKKSSIKFIVGILIATLVHYSYVVFLIVLFVKRKFKNKILFRTIAVEIAVMLAIRYGLIYRMVAIVVHSNKVLSWLNISTYDHPSVALDLVMTLLVVSSAYIIYRLNRFSSEASRENSEVPKDYTDNMIWLLIFFMPFLYLTVTFERYEAVAFSVLAILLCNKPYQNDVRKIAWTVIALLMNITFYFVIHGNIFFPIFENNMLL